MKIKIIISYLLLLVLVVISYIVSHSIFDYILPLYLFLTPVVLRKKIRFSFSMKHLLFGLIAAVVVLLPSYSVLSAGRVFHLMSMPAMLSQLARVSLPEEVFFRGFLQESFGNNMKGLLLVSLLFAAAHMPAFLFYKDAYALLTFFPSIVMGLLYMRTSNILPGVLFHFASNVVYQGFMI
jgi:membrane protease YdiL (CAAX protease family)